MLSVNHDKRNLIFQLHPSKRGTPPTSTALKYSWNMKSCSIATKSVEYLRETGHRRVSISIKNVNFYCGHYFLYPIFHAQTQTRFLGCKFSVNNKIKKVLNLHCTIIIPFNLYFLIK